MEVNNSACDYANDALLKNLIRPLFVEILLKIRIIPLFVRLKISKIQNQARETSQKYKESKLLINYPFFFLPR